MDQHSNSSPNGKSSPRKGGKKFVFEPPPEAPVFRPTAEEFKDPLEYIKKIRPIGEKTGICKIIPPNWRNPFALDMNTLKFVPRIQRINELEARTRIKLNFNDKLTKFFALSGKTFQVPVMEKTSLDLYTLHRKVKERGGVDVVNKEKKWGDISLSMGLICKTAPYTLKNHYDNLIQPFLLSQAKNNEDSKDDNKENMSKDESGMTIDNETGEGVIKGAMMKTGKGPSAMRELKSLRFLGPGPKMAVCDGGVLQKGLRTRGKKIMYEFDPLAKYMCKGCKKGDIEETFLVMCVACEDRYHHSCLIPPLSLDKPPLNWRCPKCVAAEGYKPLEEFGFAQAEREYTLNEFKAMANEFKRNYFNMDPDQVEHAAVEQEFWRVVSSIDEAVTVEYGADLHVIEHGSGFPRLNQPCVPGVDPKKFEKYANSPWNLNNLPVLEDSVLRHISADISGMKIPWMYAGMCFATFCWHNEDHWSYSVNYLHLGEAKTWYGVPGSYAEQFEAAMQKAAPELFESQPDLLHQLVTIMNPNDIMAAGVPVYRTDQKRGEFVITFPRAYHAGFNQGFNFAEACNFAPADWLVIGRECISHYSLLGRTCVFSHDELVCKMAIIFDTLERDMGLVLVKDLALMVEAERLRRTRALKLGVGNAVHVDFVKLPDDERQCYICNTTVFLSAVTCPCDYSRLVCLDHITKLCSCDAFNYIMKYQLKLDILQNLLVVTSSKLCGFDNWTKRVEEALNGKNEKKVSLRKLTELLVEAKEKEFPHSELVELLEYHVRRCIECSALSKALVANCSKKDNPSKITVEDLELFYQEIEKLPCSISEEAAVKDILDKTKKFQKFAQRVLSMKDVHKTRVLSCYKMGQSLNLDLPEMQELEKKMVEFDWVEKVEFAIDAEADLDFVSKLAEDGQSLRDSPLVEKTRKDLNKYINDRSTDIAIVNVQSIADLEGAVIQGPPISLRDQTNDIERSLLNVLHGDVVLYLNELEKLVVIAKAKTPSSRTLKQVVHHVTVARNWAMAAKALFLKKNDPHSLMDALWPRKFVSRHLYFAKQVVKQSTGIETCIKKSDPKHFKRSSFKRASMQEFHTLSKLRLENIRLMDTDDSGMVKCICGNSVDSTVIVCELCHTPMHLTCFRETDSTRCSKVTPSVWDENFRVRRLCGYCKRTNRPSIDSVKKLANTVDRLKVKIPECFAVKYTLARVEKWRRDLRDIISLDVLTTRSRDILSFFQKFHAKRYSGDPASDQLMDECRLIIGSSKGIPRVTLLALKEELIHGSRFEITPPELNDIWNIINPEWIHSEVESRLYNGLCYPLRGESSCTQPNLTTLVQHAMVRKPMKRKIPSAPPVSTTEALGGKMGSKKKKKTPLSQKKKTRKQTFPSHSSSNNPTEEHEPEANCAAPTCVKPGDAAVDWVMCDGACKQWFHMKCVDLDNKDVNDEFEYICTNCVCNRVCDQVTEGLGSNAADPLYFLSQFMNKVEHPDIDVRNFTQQTISVSEKLSKLTEGINLLDKELQRQVLEKHEDLVSQATWVEKLQGVLSIMHIHVQSLVSSIERVRMKVVDPFNRLETQTKVLARLHSTTDLLRRTARIQQLAKRLPGAEPLKAAHILSELEELNRDVDLSGIEILEQEEKQIKKEAIIIEEKASRIIDQGLADMNHEMVATGIEIMVKLGKAEVEVQKLMDKLSGNVESSVREALDMDTLVPPTSRVGAGRAAGLNIPTNTPNFRNKLWTTWEYTLTTHVYTACAQMVLVQNVLNKTLTNSATSSVSGIDDKSEIAILFWNQVDDIMTKYLLQAAKGSSYMKQALEGEYPKLLRLHLDLHKKLRTLNPSDSSSKSIFPSMGKCVKKFETEYLLRSVMLVLDAVREMFPEGVPQTPSTDKVDSLIKLISRELSVSLVDEALTVPVARNIAKAVSLFCQKGEEMLVNTPDASQVIEAPNVSQELNVSVSNIVHYFCEQMKSVVSNLGLSRPVATIILNAVEAGGTLSQQILNPLLASILVAMESILLTMHNEDYNLTDYNGSVSLYLRELQTFTARAVATYLTPFHNQIQVANSCLEVTSRAIGIFLRHATLVRPLSDEGRKKLTADFKTFEDAISPLCAQLSELGTLYSTLRSLRPLIAATPEEVASSPVLGQVIPYSLAIMLLFSWGPPELPSPHESVGWTVSKLSEWLDNHSNERDTLELLSGAVKKYEQFICAQNKSSFHEVYPTIKALLEKGIKSSSGRQRS